MLVAAMNPCPCGHLGDRLKECRCTTAHIRRYRSKISGPLLDRIDIQVEAPALTIEELRHAQLGEPSEAMRVRIEAARAIQRQRFGGRMRACNAVLIKPNQAGTISETLAALDAAKACGFSTIVSARSGESEDVMIAHLAVGWTAGQLKVGSFARSERMAKWNELLRIEEALGSAAQYAGVAALPLRR
jgi:hypothetical protein